MSTLRVGRISALNMFPVYYGLENAPQDDLQFVDGVPAELNAALLGGDLDVSAVSSIAYARNSDRLNLMPVASITADGAVDSIQLFSNVPFARVRRVAVTPESATSVALLRILLGPGPPEFTPLNEPIEDALAHMDAVLLIGDRALVALRAEVGRYRTDLAEAWRARTGLPMVFAVWASRREVEDEHPEMVASLGMRIRDARAQYDAEPEIVSRVAAERFPFPLDYVRGYLRRLRYDFGPAERAGLERFLEMARAAGLLDAVPELAA